MNNILDLITDEKVIEIMSENGSPLYGRGTTSDNKNYLIFKTICHGGNSEKLYYYSESKTFHCWTNCGTMSFFTLISKIRHFDKEDFTSCLKYVANKVGYSLSGYREGFTKTIEVDKDIEDNLNLYNDFLLMDKGLDFFSKDNSENRMKNSYDNLILDYFDNSTFYEGWIKEGISVDSMRKFNISYYWLENYIIIPHLNEYGYLSGIRRRSLKPEDSKNKYMPLILNDTTYGHSLGANLYGLFQNKKSINSSGRAVLVEGEKSVLLSDTYYNDSSVAVATCGFNISDVQINHLLCNQVHSVTIAFDKDFDPRKRLIYESDPESKELYENYMNKLRMLYLKLKKSFSNVNVILDTYGLLNEKDSPFDKGKEIYEELLSKSYFYDEKLGKWICNYRKKV